MKTRLDASMVAAKTHRSAPGAQGALARVERAMASSQGVRTAVLNVKVLVWGITHHVPAVVRPASATASLYVVWGVVLAVVFAGAAGSIALALHG
ncbi:MAG: hypothetical protein ACXWCY_27475 [Burkholderiales bacterium]